MQIVCDVVGFDVHIVCDVVGFDLHIVCDVAYDIVCYVSFDSIRGVQMACALALGQHFA